MLYVANNILYVANNTRYAVSTPTTAHITFNRSPQYGMMFHSSYKILFANFTETKLLVFMWFINLDVNSEAIILAN